MYRFLYNDFYFNDRFLLVEGRGSPVKNLNFTVGRVSAAESDGGGPTRQSVLEIFPFEKLSFVGCAMTSCGRTTPPQCQSVQLGQKEFVKAIVSVLFQMIWRPIVGGASDSEDVTLCESEDAAMADLHEVSLGLRTSVFS